MLKRAIEPFLEAYLAGDTTKILFMWGPRRSGKTTLLKKIAKEHNLPIFNFDLLTDKELFIPRREALEKLVAEQKVILIDEVQNYPESTGALKILHDEFKVKIIATGSSELRQKAKEDFDSLADRYIEQFCLPLSIYEIAENEQVLSYEKDAFAINLQSTLQIFGAYPEIYASTSLSEAEKIEKLQLLFDAYVLKDIITINDLKNEKLAKDILTKIALQIGNEVSIRELAMSLGANQTTVANYIEVFIKNYILIPLPSFKTNLRSAVSENRKLYFYDLGLRNVLVKDFRELALRPDKGGVFENFIVAEMEKRKRIYHIQQNMYFYREYGGKEVDIVLEDYKKNYICLEIKMNEKRGNRNIFPFPNTFIYLDSHTYFERITEALNIS